jgi:hypothetical protein
MQTDFLAWSHSRRKTFLDCPRQLWHNIAPRGHPDRVEYVETKEKTAGTLIDNALSARIAQGTPLPPQYAPYEGMCQVVAAAPGVKVVQAQIALDRAFKQCGTKDWDNAWVRVIYDVAILNGDVGFIGDWKNGKVWIDEDQLKLFAAVGFHVFPELQTIDTAYIWLSHGVLSPKTYTRRELADMWQALLPDVERMQVAYKTNTFPATPKYGKGTCKWCPANAAGKCKEARGPYGR